MHRQRAQRRRPTKKFDTEEEGRVVSATGEAADAASGQDADIIVTGSLIPQSQLDSTATSVQISSEQIAARGFTNLLDAINDVPLVGGGASPFGTNGGQPGSLGSSKPDVLDFGTQRTLTLLNGRRFISDTVASLFVAGNATGSQVNTNALPSGLTQRLDVLAASGAVAYGADTVAGVINAVLKTDFQGFRLTATSGISERGDGAFSHLTALGGTNFAGGRGNVTASFEYSRDDALTGASRPNIARSFVAPTSFRNGAVRNIGFSPSLSVTSLSGGAFLPQATDGVPNNIAGRGYENGGFYTQWVWVWQNRTRLFSAGAPVEGTNEVNEVQDYIRYPAFSTHNATIGYAFGEEQRFGLQLAVQNILDKQEIGPIAQSRAFGVVADNIGRRFVLSANLSF